MPNEYPQELQQRLATELATIDPTQEFTMAPSKEIRSATASTGTWAIKAIKDKQDIP